MNTLSTTDHSPGNRSGRPCRRPALARSRGQGFTLIELIGVLAVIAILAALAVPVVIKRVDRAAWSAEVNNLDSISAAIVSQMLRSNSIPSEATWAQAAANWLAYPASNITTNRRNNSRAYLIDTNGWLGANLPTTGYFFQGTNGTTAPSNARLMIVSSIGKALPVSTGRPSTASFNDIWNTKLNSKPSTWSGWTGNGDDLVIERVNLGPLFYQLILNNRDTNSAASFYINTTNTSRSVASQPDFNAYFISGSVVGLSSNNSAAQITCPLAFNNSYVFENGIWRNQIANGPNDSTIGKVPPGTSFNLLASNFVNVAENPVAGGNSGKGGDQQQVLAAMVNFMTLYQLWANNPHGPFTTYSINTGTNYDSMYASLQYAASLLQQTAGTNKSPNAITGLLQ